MRTRTWADVEVGETALWCGFLPLRRRTAGVIHGQVEVEYIDVRGNGNILPGDHGLVFATDEAKEGT